MASYERQAMTPNDKRALLALLEQMRGIHAELSARHAGVCVLHLDASIAALESHIRRGGMSVVDELRSGRAMSSPDSAGS